MVDDLPRLAAEVRGSIIKLSTFLSLITSVEGQFDKKLKKGVVDAEKLESPTLSASCSSLSHVATHPSTPSGQPMGLTPGPRHVLSATERGDLLRKRSEQCLGFRLPNIVSQICCKLLSHADFCESPPNSSPMTLRLRNLATSSNIRQC
jgi:hypothetical protein